ncbi:MRPL10 [Auxenochlorella protothecoides x Auxenochlorella symbiontica]
MAGIMSSFMGGTALLSSSTISDRHCFRSTGACPRPQRQLCQPRAALSRKGKEQTLQKLVPLLEKSSVIVGLRYKGLTVKQLQEFRAGLPEGSKLMVCKNTLVSVAAKQVSGWDGLTPIAKGDNAWFFMEEETISQAVKAYIDFEKKLKEALPREVRKEARPIDVSGGVIEGQDIDYLAFKSMEKMPSRQELMATIARLINGVPTKLARSIKAVPTKLAISIKALADADEDKSQRVGDVLPRQPPTEAAV